MIGYDANNERTRCSPWFWVIAFLVVVCPVAGLGQKTNQSIAGQADEDEPKTVCRLATDMVLVEVEVKDRSGVTVSGLTCSHFVIYEDGILQPLAFFEDEEEPSTGRVKYKIGYFPEKLNRIQENPD